MSNHMKRSALCYEVTSDAHVRCTLCPRQCVLSKNQLGFCGVRRGGEGTLETLSYGKASAVQLDPIEKKPLYHFKPGSTVLSVGGVGCNLRCDFCQNHHLLDLACPTVQVSSEDLIAAALSATDCSGIAFTYNEPTLQLEWILDVARLAHADGLSIVMVSNGYMTLNALESFRGHVDVMNIDIKGFSEDYYQSICHGTLEPVKAVIEKAAQFIPIELTYLAVHPLNTDLNLFKQCVEWVSQISADIPFHISRYFPCHKMSEPPTPLSVLYDLKQIAEQVLNHVYIGNVAGADHSIFCPQCKTRVDLEPYSRLEQAQKMSCKKCGGGLHITL